MKISVIAKTGTREERVEKISDYEFKIFTKTLPKENEANEAIKKLLADYFKIAKSRINIIIGQKAKKKVINIS